MHTSCFFYCWCCCCGRITSYWRSICLWNVCETNIPYKSKQKFSLDLYIFAQQQRQKVVDGCFNTYFLPFVFVFCVYLCLNCFVFLWIFFSFFLITVTNYIAKMLSTHFLCVCLPFRSEIAIMLGLLATKPNAANRNWMMIVHYQRQVVRELELYQCHIFNICWLVYRWDIYIPTHI